MLKVMRYKIERLQTHETQHSKFGSLRQSTGLLGLLQTDIWNIKLIDIALLHFLVVDELVDRVFDESFLLSKKFFESLCVEPLGCLSPIPDDFELCAYSLLQHGQTIFSKLEVQLR